MEKMMIIANCSRATSSTLGSTCEFPSTENLNEEESTPTKILMESLNIKHMIADSIFEGIGYLNYEKKFWDVNIHVKGQRFCCHRVLLASVSKFFENNLAPDNKKNYPFNVFIINDNVTPQLFGSLLEILHTGKDPVTVESVKDYLKMSAYLQIDFLTKYCESFLMNNFTANNVLSFWKFAQAHSLPNVAKICYTWAAEHIDILPQDELLSLPKSMLLIILSLQKKLSMDAVCQTILSWVEIDLDKRQTYLEELLPFVCFPHLSPSYLFDLSCNLRYQLNDVLCGGISQGVEFYLKGICGNDANIQMQILAQQTVKLQLPDIAPCCVAIGVKTEMNSSPQGIYTISTKTCCPLAPVPKNPGLHFASCTWQNAIYLSGGVTQPNFFAVYRPGDNQWQELPDLPGNGRAQHAMAAVNSCIYVIGGSLSKRRFPNNRQPSSVLKYDLKSSTWHDFCILPEDVLEATAAVLGHRIYLFGGVNSDLVQCVDTCGCSAYTAGYLPCTLTLRALSNGGIIYVVLSPKEILRMWETF
ncbi:ectoderm-neural cortex protein 1-like isoform X1 [Pomacea canaliculata]|uniref:ectoderm-neural cortex protein 1-like isoform X1 n=1 Tax=Pomacea canaliculata TaxID=400727 RepID=UPI000D72A73C|nr:ectoderm-neural cortex protein 1-like isoform X1 [Pomacea canaliculata]XP_025103224.1 ectoderm-neural cortex protein 1-like isoform X1 [Pomacea canaliculata]XP_025103225.1 ectoderm-neural cortex protein 1-like isoform X1 [Pomacea canaliculata]